MTTVLFRRLKDGRPVAIFPTVPGDPDGMYPLVFLDGRFSVWRCDLRSVTDDATDEERADLVDNLSEHGFSISGATSDDDSVWVLSPEPTWTAFHDKQRRDRAESDSSLYEDSPMRMLVRRPSLGGV